MTEALLPLIKKSPAGRIVNLSSILGSLTLHADPNSPIYDAKSFAYDASKTALNAFTIHLAHELRGTNIKVNSAHPGWVKSDMGGPHATMDLSEGARPAPLRPRSPRTAPLAATSIWANRCLGESPGQTISAKPEEQPEEQSSQRTVRPPGSTVRWLLCPDPCSSHFAGVISVTGKSWWASRISKRRCSSFL